MLILAEVSDKIIVPFDVAVVGTFLAALGLALSLMISRWCVLLLVGGAVLSTSLAFADYYDTISYTEAVVREVGTARVVDLALAANVPFLIAIAIVAVRRDRRSPDDQSSNLASTSAEGAKC